MAELIESAGSVPAETVAPAAPLPQAVAAPEGKAVPQHSAGQDNPAAAPVPAISAWGQCRAQGRAALSYLLDSEVHTYAFSVAANAILSFIPFCILLYTLALRVFHSPTMVRVIDAMVNYFLPTATQEHDWLVKNILAWAARSSAGGIQVMSLVMILISCTGIFLPLEVALNQAWGVSRNRNYLKNQLVALGLAVLMLVLGMASIVLNLEMQKILGFVLVLQGWFHHPEIFAWIYDTLSYAWLSMSTGAASILFFFSIYQMLPNRKVPWRPVLRTSILTGLVWLAARAIFVAVLPHLKLGDVYGPFYVSVGLLLWAYISGLILFAGAQFSVSRLRLPRE